MADRPVDDAGDPDEGWVVRPVTGAAARKAYLCPWCQQEVRVGQPHLVVWPADYVAGDPTELRRHWHTACWRRASPAERHL